MSWLNVTLRTRADGTEAVADALEAAGAIAVSVQGADDEAVLEPDPGARPLWRSTAVSGLFDASADRARLRADLGAALAGLDCSEPAMRTVEDEDWIHAWRERAPPRQYGRGLWVLPRDAPAPPAARAVVRLEPGLAFGTGAHPTTALCLEWLTEQALDHARVLDYGCGSGILAIAAAKLGAARVVAVDHDPQARAATRDNAAANGEDSRVTVLGDGPAILALEAADVVVANILANALDRLADRLAVLTRAGGRLALCGILEHQVPALRRRYSGAFALGTPRVRDGWALLQGDRRTETCT